MTAPSVAAVRAGLRNPGVLVTAVVALVFLGLAVSIDFPGTAKAFKGDEATYYSLTYSLARDRDFTFQRQDLIRVWEEFNGPDGIFLKRGSEVDFHRASGFPFFTMERTPDRSKSRLYYGKSYIYPLFASPFVWLFGTPGFLVFHALLLTLNVAIAYRFLAARGSSPGLAGGFAAVFLFASVTPVYFVWLAPELFNFTLVMTAFFCWAYKRAALPADRDTRLERFLRSPSSDYAALALLGIATFSKPTHLLLTLPIGATALFAREWRRLALMIACFIVVVSGLFGLNAYTTGEFSYQGGERKTFYGATTGFPFANTWETFDNRGVSMATDAVPFDILLHRDTAPVLAWNALYFTLGRYSGLLPYFFPGLVAAALFLARGAERRPWQAWIAAGLVASAVALMAYMPYTYSGGGGPIGNRYFLSFYPLFLFLMPALRSVWPIVLGLAVGTLFTAKILLNPFYSSANPGDHASAGPLRWLPIERTLLNDLPVSARGDRARRALGGSPPVQAYFVDDNAFAPEGDGFWVRGESRADVLLRAPAIDAADRVVSLRIRSLSIEVTNGGAPNHIVVSAGWDRVKLDMAPGEVRAIQVTAGSGVPYKPSRFPTNFVYGLSISTSAGFVPFLHDSSNPDSRYLGALVRVVPIYFNQ